MLSSLLEIAKYLLKLFTWWREDASDPKNQYQKATTENEKIIKDGDADGLNGKLDSDCNRL